MSFEYKAGPLSEVDTLDDVCDRGNTTDQIIEPAGLDLADSEKIRLGTGNDATIYYDDTNLVIGPKVVGVGIVKVEGKGSFEDLDIDTLNLNGNVITDSTGAISFSTSNLSGSGTLDFDGLTVGATAGGSITDIKDEDNMVSDSQTALATQQSIKAYADALTLDNVCDIGSTTDQVIEASGFTLTTDSDKILLGTAEDAAIYYNNTNLVIDPKEVGTGYIDTNGGSLKTGCIGLGTAPIATSSIKVANSLSSASSLRGLYFSPTLNSSGAHVYGILSQASITIGAADRGYNAFSAQCLSLTFSEITGTHYKGIEILQPTTLVGTLVNNYGIKIENFAKGTNNYAIRTNLGDVSLGDDLVLRNNSDKIYLGATKDVSLSYNGTNLVLDIEQATTTVVINPDGDDTDFVFGSSQLDDTGTPAQDTRMFFDKATGAFRVGTTTTTEWNNANLGSCSAATGYNTRAGGNFTFATGYYSKATGDMSSAFGIRGWADKFAQCAQSGGYFAALGDAQGSTFIARKVVTHSDANWYPLYLDGTDDRLTIGTNTVWTFDILLVGTTSGCTKSFGFKINGVIENDGGTTTLLASNVTTLYDTDDTDFDACVTADDVNDALLIEVTDATSGGDVVRWVAKMETVEVSF